MGPNRALANLRKHGVSFEQAARIFSDPSAVTIFDADHSSREDRWITLGRAGGDQLLVTIHTVREEHQESSIRIISARRATRRERMAYEAQ